MINSTKTEKLPWMQTAKSAIGTHEGSGDSKILRWAKVIGVDDFYTNTSIPWCGLFLSWCLAENGIEPVKGPLLALDWADYGLALKTPQYGCIMVFSRSGGGHVGLLIEETQTNYIILGGNQADAVSIAPHSKRNFVAARWPMGMQHFLLERSIS